MARFIEPQEEPNEATVPVPEHTPEPWCVSAATAQYRDTEYTIDRPYRHLGEDDRNSVETTRARCNAVDEANRRLIAAAPKLFAACERVANAENTLLGLLDRKIPGWRKDYLFEEMFVEVRAAVATASAAYEWMNSTDADGGPCDWELTDA